LKVLGDKLSLKSSPNVWKLLGYFKNIPFKVKKTAGVTFLGNFRKIGLIFIPLFNHTGARPFANFMSHLLVTHY